MDNEKKSARATAMQRAGEDIAGLPKGTGDALHPDYVRFERRKDDVRAHMPLTLEEQSSGSQLVLAGELVEVGNLGGSIAPGFTISCGQDKFITVCGLTEDEARALAPLFGKKIEIAIGAPADSLWGTWARITPEYKASQQAWNAEMRALMVSLTMVPASLRTPDFTNRPCTECGLFGVHLCAESAGPPRAVDLANMLEAVAVVGPAYRLRWCRADWSKGLKVGDNLFAFKRPDDKRGE